MIIRDGHIRRLETEHAAGFAEHVRVSLAEAYPHVLPCFPVESQATIVDNLLERGRYKWNLSDERALLGYAELMLSIAPNFDEQFEIDLVLSNAGLDCDHALLHLHEAVPQRSWIEAEENSQDLPLFVPPRQSLSGQEQTTAALQVIFREIPSLTEASKLAAFGHQTAERFGWQDIADAALTVASWRALYGDEFMDPAANPWSADLFIPGSAPRTAVEMVKFRIALDHERFV